MHYKNLNAHSLPAHRQTQQDVTPSSNLTGAQIDFLNKLRKALNVGAHTQKDRRRAFLQYPFTLRLSGLLRALHYPKFSIAPHGGDGYRDIAREIRAGENFEEVGLIHKMLARSSHINPKNPLCSKMEYYFHCRSQLKPLVPSLSHFLQTGTICLAKP